MKQSTRRAFLQTSALLLATAVTGSAFEINRTKQLLSFSSLGCPDWSFDQMVDFAVLHGFNGIELRGILRELDLTKCAEFSSKQNSTATLNKMQEKGLHFVDLGSSATLHFAESSVRQKNLEEGRRFIDLAHEINCPNVRVFPNIFPKDQDRNKTMDLIIKGLLELGDHAKGSGVSVLMETHGDLVNIADIETIMLGAAHPQVGLVWDISNMWSVTKEPPADAYKRLKKYIRHTHIKDEKMVNGKAQYTFLGQGDVPIFEGIDLLTKGGYKGYYSFEWEKLWHPEIAAPELAFADYIAVMKTRK